MSGAVSGPETFVIGSSDLTEAEYGSRADEAFTVIELYEGEVACFYGYATLAAARASLIDGGAVNSQISYL